MVFRGFYQTVVKSSEPQKNREMGSDQQEVAHTFV